ncbi:MAG: hypothetical protein V3V08_24280 [Nannocystaceae bacterium]
MFVDHFVPESGRGDETGAFEYQWAADAGLSVYFEGLSGSAGSLSRMVTCSLICS